MYFTGASSSLSRSMHSLHTTTQHTSWIATQKISQSALIATMRHAPHAAGMQACACGLHRLMCHSISQAHLVGAMGAYTQSPPDHSLMTVMTDIE